MSNNVDKNNISELLRQGYKDLGWINENDKIAEEYDCDNILHFHRSIDNSMFPHRQTDMIVVCDLNKYFYHVDMSD